MENRTMKEFIGEVFGTFILILLGDGVCRQCWSGTPCCWYRL